MVSVWPAGAVPTTFEPGDAVVKIWAPDGPACAFCQANAVRGLARIAPIQKAETSSLGSLELGFFITLMLRAASGFVAQKRKTCAPSEDVPGT